MSNEHHAGHDHAVEDDGAEDASFGGYLTGFILSVVLTAIPFWLVMNKTFDSSGVTTMVVLAFAVVQIVVHMVYFLHMNARIQGGWSMLALIFTFVLVGIALSGSLWIMFHLHENMMPVTAEQARNSP